MKTKSEEISIDAAVEQWVELVLTHIEEKQKGKVLKNKKKNE